MSETAVLIRRWPIPQRLLAPSFKCFDPSLSLREVLFGCFPRCFGALPGVLGRFGPLGLGACGLLCRGEKLLSCFGSHYGHLAFMTCLACRCLGCIALVNGPGRPVLSFLLGLGGFASLCLGPLGSCPVVGGLSLGFLASRFGFTGSGLGLSRSGDRLGYVCLGLALYGLSLGGGSLCFRFGLPLCCFGFAGSGLGFGGTGLCRYC